MKYKNAVERHNAVEMSRKELFFRLCMGLNQIKRHPYYSLALLPVFCSVIIMWLCRHRLFSNGIIPEGILNLFMGITSVLLLLILILLSVAIVKQIGILASRHIEGRLVTAFGSRDLKEGGYPILISVTYESNIIIMEFYSDIHIRRWKEKQAEIEDCLNLKILSVDYGGRRGEKGTHKVIRATRQRVRNNTAIHDEALDRELENVN